MSRNFNARFLIPICIGTVGFNVLFIHFVAGAAAMEHGLQFDSPSTTWDEALPLGNGLLGGLVWGDGVPLKISLDRTDLWDLRPVPEFQSEAYSYQRMRQWVREGRRQDLQRLYEEPYDKNAGPSKIPAGRIELSIGGKPAFNQARLDLTDALATMAFDGGDHVRVMVYANDPVGLIEARSAQTIEAILVAPDYAGKSNKSRFSDTDTLRKALSLLGYESPDESSGANWCGYVQKGWGGFRYAVFLAWKRKGDQWLGAWSIATSTEGSDPLAIARRRCEDALERGFEKALESHRQWWQSYWSQSAIAIPNAVIERQWYLEMYKFGAAARRDTPPITLQGPWTADDGGLPPWKGDYHHDLNTELSYWPCYSSNHLEGGLGFLDWLWETMPNAEAWTKRFFDKPGLNVPMTADLNNNQMGGWHQYTHSATTAAWLAHHFYLHWRYSMDRTFLEERAYPFIEQTAIFLEAVTEKTEEGLRTLPLSSSPEINDNRLDAWFPSITNYDLALIRWLFFTARELAVDLNKGEDVRRWQQVIDELPDLAVSAENKGLLVARNFPLLESHRHFSHLMSIFPLGLFCWDDAPEDQAIISSSLAELERLGTSKWTGYSFAWQACLAARARNGLVAERALEIFSKAFCLRNSFHCNGDQSDQGYSDFTYRPFTLEGNFAAAAAVQEMLLQSYGGSIKIFPAIPADWRDVSFTTLRAEGAFLVSAERKAGLTCRVEIFSETGGLCRIDDPFADEGFITEGIADKQLQQANGILTIPMTAGQKVTLSKKNST